MDRPGLQGRQKEVAYLRPSGHLVVLGTAGTGKTVMAVERALHLGDPRSENHGPVLLLTHTNSLVGYLHHLAGQAVDNVTIHNFSTFARGYLNSRHLMGYDAIADADPRARLVAQALAAVAARHQPPRRFFNRPRDFFLDELAWIEGNGLHTLEVYLAAERLGRMAALQDGSRVAVWDIRTEYQGRLAAEGKAYDWTTLPGAARAALLADDRPRRYRHIVVDEAQDLVPEAIRALAEAVQPGGSLTLFGDYAQQIYGQRMSWKSCNLNVGKVEYFLDNYRNSPQIARLAIAMAAMPHFADVTDLVEPKEPQRAAGTLPTLVCCASAAAEAELIAAIAADYGRTARVGVLARTRQGAQWATTGVPGVRLLHENDPQWETANGVYAGTYHAAKGLEFDVVLLPFCGADRMPFPDTVDAFGEQEAASRESRLLYVAVTRARDELVISYTGELTSLLPPPGCGLYEEQT